MRRGGRRKLRGRRASQHRLPWAIKRRRPRACFANGFGTEQSDQSAKFTTGRADLTGRKASNGRRKRNLFLRDSIGIYGSVRRRNVLSTALTCLLCGGDGTILDAVRLATWVRTVMTRFSAC